MPFYGKISRRTVLKGGAALVPAHALRAGTRARQSPGPRIVVVGAGAFGGWTALHLLRRGARVTLCDTWGAGHSRASSGGESRVIRHTYGERIYVDWVIRSLQLWRENQSRWGQPLYHEIGVLWMDTGGDFPLRLDHLEAAGVAHELLDGDEVAARWPQINPEGIRRAVYEPEAGYLLARRGCEAVRDAFVAEGGEYRQLACTGADAGGGEMRSLTLSDGSSLAADAYVFACGPWLGRFFAELLEGVELINPTRQEVYYFGTPATDTSFDAGRLPVWADTAGRFWYGIPGAERRGFKLADDQHGATVDPTTQDRRVSEDGIRRAREFMEHRFPAMRGAPFIEGRVCQYENSPDGNFIIDRHPRAANAWLVGGGSGHGYKHGPALGEYTAGLILDGGETDPLFALARFG